MARIPVPDDRGVVTVAGTSDHDYGEADVNLDGRDHARDLTVQEDEDGQYVGAPTWAAVAVADELGVEPPEIETEEEDDEADSGGEEESIESIIDDGVCPWCDDYEGDGVAQHASAGHPDEWAEYTED